VKGPAAKMFSELGIKPSAFAVAAHYQEIIDAIFLDRTDHQQVKDIEALGISSVLTDALMINKADRGRLAGEVIEYIRVKLKGTKR
jgi:LPPG:FO 2-phospho-L-lactate transferase